MLAFNLGHHGVGEGLLLIVVEVDADLHTLAQIVHVLSDEVAHMVRKQGAEGVDDGDVVGEVGNGGEGEVGDGGGGEGDGDGDGGGGGGCGGDGGAGGGEYTNLQ